MPIQPPKATSPFFRTLAQFEPKANEQPSDTLTHLLDIARHELMRVDDVDCYMPASSFSYEKTITPCAEGEVYTKSINIKIDGTPFTYDGNNRECCFIYSHSISSHIDYEAITHILILQTDKHVLRVDELAEDMVCKVGDIIQFNIEWSHELIATDNTELPFVGLAYDTYLSPVMPNVYPALNKKTALPFFQKLVTMILDKYMA